MLEGIFAWAIILWMVVLVGLFAIGGYFMFRKFLKSMPKTDGKSELDRQQEVIEQTLYLWTDKGKEMLNELVKPVPSPFRDAAKQTIAAKIGELALKEKARVIDQDLLIRGYILGTPRRDQRVLMAYLMKKGIDLSPYQQIIDQKLSSSNEGVSSRGATSTSEPSSKTTSSG